jgi:hypothetical protein
MRSTHLVDFINLGGDVLEGGHEAIDALLLDLLEAARDILADLREG